MKLKSANFMKKLILLVVILTAGLNSYGQIDSTVCNDLEKTFDEFTNTVYYSALVGKNRPTFVHKSIHEKKTTYTLTFNVYGSTLNVGKKGLIILMENGEKLNFPEAKIDVEAGKNGWDYSASVELSVLQVIYLAKNKISKYRLFIYDGFYDDKESAKLSSTIYCLFKKN